MTARDPLPVLRIALPRPLPTLFDYLAPDADPVGPDWLGCRVRVPFGSGRLIGVVAALGTIDPGAEGPVCKRIEARLDPISPFGGELWDSLHWAARYYHEPLGQVLATALPALLRAGEALPDTQTYGWRLTEAGATARSGLRIGGRPRRLADALADACRDEAALDDHLPGWRSIARDLARRRLVERVAVQHPVASPMSPPSYVLNPAQAEAVTRVTAAFGRFEPFLLDGVTGSGKTEVYLEAIAETLRRGRQALVLVPEIGLTPQTLRRFRDRLGVPIAASHSGLADGERSRVWTAMARGQARVLVGTRSAVFTPLPEAGLIVVDEEHDASYKQQDGFRYSARDLALVRARALAVPIILGSATPSLESLHQAGLGRYHSLALRQRAGTGRPPPVRILDIRGRRLEAGLSADALTAIGERLDRGEQVLVFKNRRGYAPVLLCHDCGWSARCRNCDAAMTVHYGGRRLICHHCGARQTPPPSCPDCASLALIPQGAGTERIEQALAARFPQQPLLRVDRETTRRRDGLQRHLAALGDGPGILVGTQILAKGHDLPRLSLVCVVGVDEGLFSADFRARERLAQLLIQVAGRAGRAAIPGEVLLQTHHPDHPLLTTLLAGGYGAFARSELSERQAAGFPPFAHLALIRADAESEPATREFLTAAAACFSDRTRIGVHGPLPAPMVRRAGRTRWQLLLSAVHRPDLHSALHQHLNDLYRLPQARRVRWSLDVDPSDLY
ncbi:MAG TPA: primosomal protein N' [Xanthomonadales bacterium]|nr:primosomal protein N' [Xanthomonadales bacterium]